MYKFAVNKAVEVATLDQLAFAPTASTALSIDTPRRLRAVTAIVLPTTRKFPADHACCGVLGSDRIRTVAFKQDDATVTGSMVHAILVTIR